MFQPSIELERKIRFNLSLGFWEVDRVVVNGCQKSEEGEERIVRGPRIGSRIGSPHRRFTWSLPARLVIVLQVILVRRLIL